MGKEMHKEIHDVDELKKELTDFFDKSKTPSASVSSRIGFFGGSHESVDPQPKECIYTVGNMKAAIKITSEGVFYCDYQGRPAPYTVKNAVNQFFAEKFLTTSHENYFYDYFQAERKNNLIHQTQESGGPLSTDFRVFTKEEAFANVDGLAKQKMKVENIAESESGHATRKMP